MERKDRNAKGGSLKAFYRPDLPLRRIKQYECTESENIFLELKQKTGHGAFHVYINHHQ